MVMQSANAVVNIIPLDSIFNVCQEFGPGVDNHDCTTFVDQNVPVVNQDPGGVSNIFTEILNTDASNFCDEFDDGDHNADCINNVNVFVGPTDQTNDPDSPPVGTNEVDIGTVDVMLNDCNETGTGNNFADCTNSGLDSIFDPNDPLNGIAINQDNVALGSDLSNIGFVLRQHCIYHSRS